MLFRPFDKILGGLNYCIRAPKRHLCFQSQFHRPPALFPSRSYSILPPLPSTILIGELLFAIMGLFCFIGFRDTKGYSSLFVETAQCLEPAIAFRPFVGFYRELSVVFPGGEFHRGMGLSQSSPITPRRGLMAGR